MAVNSNFSRRVKSVTETFYSYFGEMPEECFTSPGRVELLGNHTDHNHGLVLVSSIDLNILAVAKKTDNNIITYYSKGYPLARVDINDLDKRESDFGESIGMIRGVCYKLKELGYAIGGMDITTTTTVFKGAGVSSSAAFELLIAKMLSYYYNNDSIDKVVLAQVGQFAECEFFNKPCGLLDQMGISLGAINYIDFKSTEAPSVKTIRKPIKNYQLILINTRDSHSALTHLYAKIKDDMYALASYFGEEYLRNVKQSLFFSKKDELIEKFGEDVYLRGKHYYDENSRVYNAYRAILSGNEEEFIKMVNESGESSFYQLKNCYVNNINENLPHAILMSKELIKNGAVRVHGGGFAGTIIAIVHESEAKDYIKVMRKEYGFNNVHKIAFNSYGTRYICKVNEVITSDEIRDIKGE